MVLEALGPSETLIISVKIYVGQNKKLSKGGDGAGLRIKICLYKTENRAGLT